MPAAPEQPPSSSPLSGCRKVDVRRVREEAIERTTDYVAEEIPVALLYHNVAHVVMLASPADLEDLGVGFTLSEGIVSHANEILGVEIVRKPDSLAVQLRIASERFSALLRRQRNLTGRTGCGLCGVENVEDAIRYPPPVREGLQLSNVELHAHLATLQARQPLNLQTGSVHAAAWVLPQLGVQHVREDVGRHNALDKVIGALVREGTDLSSGYFIITSRASYEMVLKAATVGVSLVVAVSAPTAMAIDLAQQSGVTLVGFARQDRHVIYTHPHRLLD